MIEAPLIGEPPECIGAEVASIVANHTLWYSLLGKERLHRHNDGCTRHWGRDYVIERKLGIVIRHEQICLTVDDKQVGSVPTICQERDGVSCGMRGSRGWAR